MNSCFGDFEEFCDRCGRCEERTRLYCKLWKHNIFNLKPLKNLAALIINMMLVPLSLNMCIIYCLRGYWLGGLMFLVSSIISLYVIAIQHDVSRKIRGYVKFVEAREWFEKRKSGSHTVRS